eukprot:jgi/Tetstr1/438228/TSEL_002880.t3
MCTATWHIHFAGAAAGDLHGEDDDAVDDGHDHDPNAESDNKDDGPEGITLPKSKPWTKRERVGGSANASSHGTSAKADLVTLHMDGWAWFRQMVADFNDKREEVLGALRDATLDESMSAWKARTSRRGGLPNLSFIARKPEPLGTASSRR